MSRRLHLTEGTVAKNISLLAKRYPQATPNARGQLYANQEGETVLRFLDKEDRGSLPLQPLSSTTTITRRSRSLTKQRHIVRFVKYSTSDPFLLAHVDEVNKAYTYACYISVFVLSRKIIENLIMNVLRKKFPGRTQSEKELYYDTTRGRVKDFRDLLNSLESKKIDFAMEKNLVELILSKVKPFKEEADKKTHYLYHLATKSEIDGINVQNILNLLSELQSKS